LQPPLLKEVIDVGAVSPQEVQSHRVVMLHSLAHIDDPHFAAIVQHVVLREVRMH
jgi:hypothetical protein